jgi:ribosome maturation factor RimP
MIDKATIESIVNEQLNPQTEFAVEISVSTGNKILVLIDSDQGVTIDRCVHISRYIEQNLDRDQEDFELEVASAGLSEPLKVPRQYAKNIGRRLDITLPTGIKFQGLLVESNDTKFTIEVEEMIVVE